MRASTAAESLPGPPQQGAPRPARSANETARSTIDPRPLAGCSALTVQHPCDNDANGRAPPETLPGRPPAPSEPPESPAGTAPRLPFRQAPAGQFAVPSPRGAVSRDISVASGPHPRGPEDARAARRGAPSAPAPRDRFRSTAGRRASARPFLRRARGRPVRQQGAPFHPPEPPVPENEHPATPNEWKDASTTAFAAVKMASCA